MTYIMTAPTPMRWLPPSDDSAMPNFQIGSEDSHSDYNKPPSSPAKEQTVTETKPRVCTCDDHTLGDANPKECDTFPCPFHMLDEHLDELK